MARAPIAALVVAALAGPAAATAGARPATPLRIVSFALAPDGTFAPGDVLRVDARIRNSARTTIRTGRLHLYLRRVATTNPSGRADASGRVPGVRPGTLVTAHAQVTLGARTAGRYRFVACVTSKNRARRCRVVRGAITVRS